MTTQVTLLLCFADGKSLKTKARKTYQNIFIWLISPLPSTCTINKLILLKDYFSKFSVHFADSDIFSICRFKMQIQVLYLAMIRERTCSLISWVHLIWFHLFSHLEVEIVIRQIYVQINYWKRSRKTPKINDPRCDHVLTWTTQF